jgi:hypothetical protein
MENIAQTINLLLLEDKSTTSVVDYFKKENNVHVHLFDNLDDVWDGLKVCSDRSKDCMHFILFFNLKLVKEDVKQFISMVKEDSVLRSTPVFILSESKDTDVMELYKSHLTNYILKPEDLDDLNRVLDSFKTFWFNLTELP